MLRDHGVVAQPDTLKIGFFGPSLILLLLDWAIGVVGPMLPSAVDAEKEALVFFSLLLKLFCAISTSDCG